VITPVSGRPNLLLGAYDLATLGYGAEEYFVSGTAASYASDATADFTTRIVVCRPVDAEFTGTVIVEWLNVSGGIDAPAVWFMAHREIVRAGFVYVAVSVQQVGVEGGMSLVGADRDRSVRIDLTDALARSVGGQPPADDQIPGRAHVVSSPPSIMSRGSGCVPPRGTRV